MNWYALDLKKTTDGSLDVYILDEIGGWGIYADEFIRDINANIKDEMELRVHINSPGGDVFQGLAIYNFLKARGNVTTINEGIAASMASVVFMAGSNRIMPENAFVMIHNPWAVRVGNADELREAAEAMDKLGDSLAGIYVKNTDLPIEDIKEMMKAETLMNGKEALDKGFATMITDAVEIAASFDIAKLNKVPASMASSTVVKEKTMEQLKEVQAKLDETTKKLEAKEKEYEAKAKESFTEGVAAGEEQALGKVKARMERYNNEKFVIETIDLDDSQVKDKYIAMLEADNKLKADALNKLAEDDGATPVAGKASGDEPADSKKPITAEAKTAARTKLVEQLKADGMKAEDAWRKAYVEIPEKEGE